MGGGRGASDLMDLRTGREREMERERGRGKERRKEEEECCVIDTRAHCLRNFIHVIC